MQELCLAAEHAISHYISGKQHKSDHLYIECKLIFKDCGFRTLLDEINNLEFHNEIWLTIELYKWIIVIDIQPV